ADAIRPGNLACAIGLGAEGINEERFTHAYFAGQKYDSPLRGAEVSQALLHQGDFTVTAKNGTGLQRLLMSGPFPLRLDTQGSKDGDGLGFAFDHNRAQVGNLKFRPQWVTHRFFHED